MTPKRKICSMCMKYITKDRFIIILDRHPSGYELIGCVECYNRGDFCLLEQGLRRICDCGKCRKRAEGSRTTRNFSEKERPMKMTVLTDYENALTTGKWKHLDKVRALEVIKKAQRVTTAEKELVKLRQELAIHRDYSPGDSHAFLDRLKERYKLTHEKHCLIVDSGNPEKVDEAMALSVRMAEIDAIIDLMERSVGAPA